MCVCACVRACVCVCVCVLDADSGRECRPMHWCVGSVAGAAAEHHAEHDDHQKDGEQHASD